MRVRHLTRLVPASRSLVVAVLLLLTLVVAAALGWHGWHQARARAELARQVLRDYAGTAAWEYARRSERALLIALDEALRAARFLPGRAAEAERLSGAPPPPVPSEAPFTIRPALGSIRLDLRSGQVVGGNIDLSDRTRVALCRAVQERLRIVRPDGIPFLLFLEEHPLRVFGVSVPPGGDGNALAVETTPGALAPLFSRVFERDPLLPPSLMRGAPNDSLVAVLARTTSGMMIFRSDEMVSHLPSQPLDPRFGGLIVSASVRPEAVEHLIAGGGAGFSWWSIGGLLGLEVMLVAATLLQFRRQRELARLRTEFVSAASHELRTPLAQIRLFAETLLLGRVRSRDEERRALQIIDQEARRLSTLVENVLLFSRGEKRMNHVVPAAVALTPLVAGVVETFGPLARARQVEVALQSGDATCVALADRGALQQVLLNLLDNAVKYGPEGQRIEVSVRRVGESVQILVEDQGPGIAEADRERVWQAFYRSSRERASVVAGTGIGLAVVRELVALHGGRAWHEPRGHGGTRFVVELPAAPLAVAPAVL